MTNLLKVQPASIQACVWAVELVSRCVLRSAWTWKASRNNRFTPKSSAWGKNVRYAGAGHSVYEIY